MPRYRSAVCLEAGERTFCDNSEKLAAQPQVHLLPKLEQIAVRMEDVHNGADNFANLSYNNMEYVNE